MIFRAAAKIYEAAIAARNTYFDRSSTAIHRLGRRTISIGNITVGGTGKTPLVEYTARKLIENGEKVCILTRGYGRRDASQRVVVSDGREVLVGADTGGDEPVELANKLDARAVIIADADRVAAAAFALKNFDVSAFVLDDGFQHRRAGRDVDIVCIDASDPFGGERLLPAGRLREPISSLRRAQAIVLTRVDLAADTAVIKERIRHAAPHAVILEARTTAPHFVRVGADADRFAAADLAGKRVLVVSAIGNPQSFSRSLKSSGLQTIAERHYPDHHRYTPADAELICREAAAADAEMIVTTGKDAVKLAEIDVKMPVYAAHVSIVLDNEAEFLRLVVG